MKRDGDEVGRYRKLDIYLVVAPPTFSVMESNLHHGTLFDNKCTPSKLLTRRILDSKDVSGIFNGAQLMTEANEKCRSFRLPCLSYLLNHHLGIVRRVSTTNYQSIILLILRVYFLQC